MGHARAIRRSPRVTRAVVCCRWCGSVIVREDGQPRMRVSCGCCRSYAQEFPWPVVLVSHGAPEWRDPHVHLWYSDHGWRHVPASGRTHWENGRHAWPKQRREKRETKRLGTKLRRRAWARAWQADLALDCAAETC